MRGELVGYPNVLAYPLFGRTDGAAQRGRVPCGSARVVPGVEEACAVSVDGLDKTELYSSQRVGRTVSQTSTDLLAHLPLLWPFRMDFFKW